MHTCMCCKLFIVKKECIVTNYDSFPECESLGIVWYSMMQYYPHCFDAAQHLQVTEREICRRKLSDLTDLFSKVRKS